jgi:hypothetical protein
MLKNIFKSAKQLLKSPIGQIGIGLLAPGFGFNPAVASGIAGLLAGDKPANVARNLGITALLGGATAGPGRTFSEGVMDTFRTPTGQIGKSLSAVNPYEAGTVGGTGSSGGGILDLLKSLPQRAIEAAIEDPIKAAEATLLLTAFLEGQNDPRLLDVDPNVILDRSRFKQELEESPFQNATGGIAGYAMGGEKKTSIGINPNTGEPSGLVTGPGTGKSDSIRFVSSEAKVPTDISNGEFIITKEATDKIGPENLYALQTAFDKDAETFEEGQERMAMV